MPQSPSDMSLERLPPHDLKAELAFLGSLLLSLNAHLVLAKLDVPLQGKHFYSTAHREIFEAILDVPPGEPTDSAGSNTKRGAGAS